jgi:hypothetical protein
MDRIKQKIRIPIKRTTEEQKTTVEEQKASTPMEYAEIDVDSSKEKISKLINSIIVDENFRTQFNKNPEKSLKEVGISLDQATAEKLKESSITKTLRDSIPASGGEPHIIGALAVAIIGVISPATDTGPE